MLTTQALVVRIKTNLFIAANVKVSIIISLNAQVFLNNKVRAMLTLSDEESKDRSEYEEDVKALVSNITEDIQLCKN